MKYFVLALLLASSFVVTAQTVEQPGSQYSSYTLLLVPAQKGEGVLMAIDKQQKIVFIPISSIKKALDEDGAAPVRYGDLLQLVRQLSEEVGRLKTENDHLWKVAENRPGAAPTVVVQQPAPPPPDPDAERRQMREILLRSLLSPRSSNVNVNVTDCSRYPASCIGR